MWSWQKSLELLSGREASLDDNFPKKLCQPCFHKIKKHLQIAVFNEKESIFAEAFVG